MRMNLVVYELEGDGVPLKLRPVRAVDCSGVMQDDVFFKTIADAGIASRDILFISVGINGQMIKPLPIFWLPMIIGPVGDRKIMSSFAKLLLAAAACMVRFPKALQELVTRGFDYRVSGANYVEQ